MKVQKFICTLLFACFTLISCQKEIKKEIKKENVSLAISGMTCEVGCAKTIQSKLTKKEGVLAAKVVFSDSIATVEFDANTLSKKDLIAFVDGISGGDLYTASEISNQKHLCADACKSTCEMMETKKTCKEDCKMECCKEKKA
jgi:mercuric ion binding protein